MISAAARNLRIAASPLLSLPLFALADELFASIPAASVAVPAANPFLIKERRFADPFKSLVRCFIVCLLLVSYGSLPKSGQQNFRNRNHGSVPQRLVAKCIRLRDALH